MNTQEWNSIVRSTPTPHFLQTWEWAEVKKAYGWKPIFHFWEKSNQSTNSCALMLKRTISYPFIPIHPSMIYVPKGPLTDWCDLTNASRVIKDTEDLCRKNKSIYVKIDPDVILFDNNDDLSQTQIKKNEVSNVLVSRGWQYSNDQIQFKNTVMLNIADSEENILSGMKQKTRYNIHLSERRGVKIRKANRSEFSELYKLYAETSIRDHFVIRPEAYYSLVWDTFLSQDMAEFFVAEYNADIIAAIFVVYFDKSAWYLYGMSQNDHREKMPNHLLQWHAICEAKKRNITQYDLWGAPEIFDETDSMWGVYRFKEGFGGKIIRTIGAWDYPVYPQLYSLYTKVVPKIINSLRKRGLENTRRSFQ